MADITKRTAKRIVEHLQPGEQVEVAMLIEPKGTYGPGMVAVAMLPRTMSRHLTEGADKANQDAGGLAATFPGESAALAVTNHRVMVVPSNGIKFQAPAAEYPLGSVAVGEVTRKGLGRRMQLVFADGSAVQVDMQRGQPLDRFTELVGAIG